ncbi:NADH-quinone oxidoreductase subunit C 1 [bacterium BMS3Bbin02]|nr:NADH-quinone oxidoreductase subunit C 1 [bacterium BMS3Bbin02]
MSEEQSTTEETTTEGVEDAGSDRVMPTDENLAALACEFASAEFEVFEATGASWDIVTVSSDDYHGLVAAAHAAGYTLFIDLCAVDYLRRTPRFDVVVHIESISAGKRLRIKIGVPASDPSVASISDVFAGANFFEREAYDLMGITFTDHPDMTRILLPDEWEGHPLRKDASVGSVPVQFKASYKAP